MKATHRSRELLGGILRAALVGACGGCVALLFNQALISTQGAMFGESFERVVLAGGNVLTQVRELPWWQRLAIPGAGMLVGALALTYLARVGKGGGFADVMEGVSAKRGGLAFWPTIGRALAAFAIVVTGNSVGREGLIIVVAAAAASGLTRVLKFPVKDRGLMLGCGVAAGFAAAYNAPIAGAVFALEIVLGNFAMELFAPVVVASVSAILVTRYAGKQTAAIYEITRTFKL
jgi:CIC family chloride channel protein